MIKVDEGQANINVKVAPESQIAVGIEPKKKIDVIVGDAAKMDCQRAINYIKSGEAEIDAYVDGTAKPAIDSYVNTTSKAAIDDYVANTAEPAIDAYVTNTAEPAIDSYVTNTAIPQVDSYVSLAKQWAIGDPTEPVGNSAKYWAEEAATTVSNMANKDLSNLSATGEAKFAAKQDVISDLSTIRSGAALGATAVQSVTTGTTNGTIKVDGNAVSVYGLGSAAYTSSTDYDAAGSASTAETSAKNYADSLASNYATAAQGAKADTAVQPSDLATVATTGSYDDLTNKPTIPAAQVNSDWNANSGVAQILNKPTIPTVNNATLTITQGGVNKGTFTANASSDVTIALDAGGGGGAVWGGITGDIDDQTDLKNALDAKQDVISDLATIRSGAELGATAVQPADLATVATSGDYDDLLNKPTIPTVNDATLTIQKNGVDVQTFTANASTNATANITVPTDTGDLTNGAGFITGITSGDVTTALGYTPYSDANPNGYTSNVGTVTSVNNTSPDGNGNVTLSIPAAQVNSDWNANSGVSEILNKPTIPTVNNATISFTQGGVSKGSITLNQATDQTIALDAGGGGGGSYTAGTGIDITSGVISVTAPTLTNTATGSNALTILGTVGSGVKSVNIGELSSSARNGVAIGYQAQNTGSYNVCVGYNSSNSVNLGYSVALGGDAKTTAAYAIQLGYGTNSEANSFYVSTSSSNNWKMLGSDGLIPSARLPIATSVSSSSTNSETVGAKLFYDTCGDIETLINAL